MYIILVYDVDKKRCGKMLRLCRKYLHHIQNSVFEGEITEGKLEELKIKAKKIMKNQKQQNVKQDNEINNTGEAENINEDSLIIFKSRNEKWLDKEIVGKDKKPVDNIL